MQEVYCNIMTPTEVLTHTAQLEHDIGCWVVWTIQASYQVRICCSAEGMVTEVGAASLPANGGIVCPLHIIATVGEHCKGGGPISD